MGVREIWKLPESQINHMLKSHNFDPTAMTLSANRARVAMLLYNLEQLDTADSDWVSHPDFFTVMSNAESLKAGLLTSQKPFLLQTLRFIGLCMIADSTLRDVLVGEDPISTQLEEAMGEYVSQTEELVFGTIVDSDIYRLIEEKVESLAIRPNNLEELFENITESQDVPFFARDIWKWHILDKVQDNKFDKFISDALDSHISNITNPEDIALESSPTELLEKLLKQDVSKMVPISRCFLLYSIWEIRQTVPHLQDIASELDSLIEQYGCRSIFASETAPSVLSIGLLPVLGPLIHLYLDPPPRNVVLHRLQQL